MARSTPTPSTRWYRVWLALLALPLTLAVAFGGLGAVLVLGRGRRGDELVRAIEANAALPTALGFGAAFLITRWLARKDGLSLAAIGWARPRPVDVAIGLGTGALLWLANALALYPLVQAALPAFDPTLAAQSLPATLIMLSIAIASEETLYRGYAFATLQPRHGTLVALGSTSLLYALITPAGWPLMLWALYFGALLGLLRHWRKNLWPGVIAHLLVSLGPKLLAQW